MPYNYESNRVFKDPPNPDDQQEHEILTFVTEVEARNYATDAIRDAFKTRGGQVTESFQLELTKTD